MKACRSLDHCISGECASLHVCKRLLMTDLSPEAKAARKPEFPPHVLMNARQDKVHIEPGRTRRVKAVKLRRTSNTAKE